ncbi:MAG: rhamnulokinase [Planctomycetaceae bacterium]|jgi:rhamnulokinase|nr:rhamnulokinase [Planctomycetaceae bacterium]
MATKSYLAIDMGASSGRHIVGHFDGDRIHLEEIYRFENGPVEMAGNLYWNLPGQWTHVLNGMQTAGAKYGSQILSVGVDTWGVDFGLLGRNDTLLGNPYCYRDPRTDGAMERAFQTLSRNEIFTQTGLQFMQFNSLYQFLVMQWEKSPVLESAESFLMMPDLFHWLMSGIKANEFTNATTTQCFNPVTHDWAKPMLGKFGLPEHLFQSATPPGTTLGKLRTSVAETAGLSANVVLPGTHDTASAVMAVPTSRPSGQTDWCYISLGTWALMGVETKVPVTSEKAFEYNFTNEGGVGGTFRLLKNISGLWLIQECRRIWNQEGKDWDWEDLNRMSASAKPLVTFINPDVREFLAPTDMPEAIRQYAARTGQRIPENEGAVLRCALESIAMKFRVTLEMCENLTGTKIETIHIVGGGTKNLQLCQAAADACGRPVVTGPVEATAIGNLMMQAVAAGDVADIPQAREVIRRSFEVMEFLPQNTDQWNNAYERFKEIIAGH